MQILFYFRYIVYSLCVCALCVFVVCLFIRVVWSIYTWPVAGTGITRFAHKITLENMFTFAKALSHCWTVPVEVTHSECGKYLEGTALFD